MSKQYEIDVCCYCGYKPNERPVSFSIGDSIFKVLELTDIWYGQDYRYFKLRADDGNIYILKYNELNDKWELEFFQKKYRTY